MASGCDKAKSIYIYIFSVERKEKLDTKGNIEGYDYIPRMEKGDFQKCDFSLIDREHYIHKLVFNEDADKIAALATRNGDTKVFVW